MRRWILYRVWHFRIIKGHLINSLQRVMYLGSVSRSYFVCKQFQQSEFVFMRIHISIVCNMKSRITIHISIDRFPCDETQRHMTPRRSQVGNGYEWNEGREKQGERNTKRMQQRSRSQASVIIFFFFRNFCFKQDSINQC